MAVAHEQEILFLNVLLIYYCTIVLFLKLSKETALGSIVWLVYTQWAFHYYHATCLDGAGPKKWSIETYVSILSLLLKAHLR